MINSLTTDIYHHWDNELLKVLVLSSVSFFFTNLDDFLILLAFFSDPKLKSIDVVLGHYLGMGIVLLVSCLGSHLGSLILPPEWYRLLGFIPIFFGARQMILARVPQKKLSQIATNRSLNSTLVVATVVLVNSSDNISVMLPLLTTLSSHSFPAFLLGQLTMAGIWCFLAFFLVRRTKLNQILPIFNPMFMSIILIFFGISILIFS
jgi:cadmium resistance protein CadD (predicted permease)